MTDESGELAAVRPTTGGWWVLASVLAIACMALAFAAVQAQQPPDRTAVSASANSARTIEPPRTTKPDPSTPVKTSPSGRPEHIRIPALGLDANVIALGLAPDRTVEVPSNPDQAGWFSLGPPPGAPGSAVILGHVDSMTGPAVFYRLRELVVGNRIQVLLSNGSTASFEVTTVKTYLNRDFPATQVYAGNQSRSILNLVTCGGEYDADRGGYQSNVVVFTRHLGTLP